MGAVYEATHERLSTRVAIKVLHAEIALRPGIVDRFLREARVSAQIRSAHVAQVIDVDRSPEGDAYMVMELLEGETLLALLERERKLSVGVACAFTLQILEALEAAHELQVVHRDLKPENVFVTHGTQKTVVKLIDFGIAKVRAENGAALTMAGVTMGTAEYMAPEQAFSADRADARSDLYAVGVMFYEMLSGQRPISGDDPRVIALKVERGEIKPLVHALPSVPPPLAGFTHRAMAPRPEMRFQSAAEMRLALEKLVGHDAGGTLPLPLAPARRVSAIPETNEPPQTAPGTLRGTPIDHTRYETGHHDDERAHGDTDVREPRFDSDPAPLPPRKSSAVPLIALAILLGVGAVVGLAALQSRQDPNASASTSSSAPPPRESLAIVTPSASANDAPSTSSELRPLKTGPVASAHVVVARDGGAPHPSASTAKTHPPASASNNNPFSFPGLPSAIPTEITLPGFGP
jgi:serine/threonine-protein kinase